MGLSQATMNAIARAQKATSISTASIGSKAFAESFEKAYSEQVEKLKKEEERKEEAKMNSLDHLEELTGLGSKLGKFKDIGETILKGAKDKIYETYDLTSQFDQTVAQRQIMADVEKELEPFGVANDYIQSLIKANDLENLDVSMKAETNFAGTKYNKYQVLQGLGEGHNVSEDGKTIEGYVTLEDKTKQPITINVKDIPTEAFKISTYDPEFSKKLEETVETFVSAATKNNFSKKEIINMVENYSREQSEDTAKTWVYNHYHEYPTDEQIKSVDAKNPNKSYFKRRLEERMTETIMSRYKREIPEVKEPETEDEPTPSELTYKAGKALYDKQINTIRGMRLPPEMSPKEYYKSQNFINDLPTNFIVEKTGEGDDMQIDIYNSDEKTMQGESRRMISVTNQSLRKLKEQLEGRVIGKEKYFEQYMD